MRGEITKCPYDSTGGYLIAPSLPLANHRTRQQNTDERIQRNRRLETPSLIVMHTEDMKRSFFHS